MGVIYVSLVPDVHLELILALRPVGVVVMVDVGFFKPVLVENVACTYELLPLATASAIPVPLVNLGGGKIHFFSKTFEDSFRPLERVCHELLLEVVLLLTVELHSVFLTVNFFFNVLSFTCFQKHNDTLV